MDLELCLDLDPELRQFKAGSRSEINHSGSTLQLGARRPIKANSLLGLLFTDPRKNQFYIVQKT